MGVRNCANSSEMEYFLVKVAKAYFAKDWLKDAYISLSIFLFTHSVSVPFFFFRFEIAVLWFDCFTWVDPSF